VARRKGSPDKPRKGRRKEPHTSKSKPPKFRADHLPDVTVLQITGMDQDGDALGRPVNWPEDIEAPLIFIAPDRRAGRAPGIGERVLAHIQHISGTEYEARIIRRISPAPRTFLAVVETGHRLAPADKRMKSGYIVAPGEDMDAPPGELVLAAEAGRDRRHGTRTARVVERLGTHGDAETFSLASIHANDIPFSFSDAALAQAAAAGPPTLDGRTDLRDLPLVTIDGEDARDFDDAVFAEPDPKNPSGWHLVVAIADVAWYVRPGDALDLDARDRGNSVYLPDRVVPMLPEELSNGWCSLRPNEDRACLAVHLHIDAEGKLLSHRFERAMMRSAARLTYKQVHAAFESGDLGDLANLKGAFEALDRERAKREPLDLTVPEKKVIFEKDRTSWRIEVQPVYESHRLIEEFMIAANVAAAETLNKRRQPAVYRVHDDPPPEKLSALIETLQSMGYPTPKGQVLLPRHFNQLLRRAKGEQEETLLNDLILRSQAQAVYSPEDSGHFGLRLRHYTHFTSPIRRYSDLIVHRALIETLTLGEGGAHESPETLAPIAEHISMTERRAATAERDAIDRFTVAALVSERGNVLAGRISGVTRAGLFVTLDRTGGDGLVPIRLLPRDSYALDEGAKKLTGRRSKLTFQFGDQVEVRIREAEAIAGRLLLEIVANTPTGAKGNGKRAKKTGKKKSSRKAKEKAARKAEKRKRR